jgi:glucose/arabinose dehydrogenase
MCSIAPMGYQKIGYKAAMNSSPYQPIYPDSRMGPDKGHATPSEAHKDHRRQCFRGLSALATGLVLTLSACADVATLPLSAGVGPTPTLPPPVKSLIPTVQIAQVIGWAADEAPQGAPGTQVQAFARDLDHPRWLYVLPNGDVLVAETNTPPKPDDQQGIKGWITGKLMQRAGAGAASANRISLLRDTNGDGVADVRTVLLEGLNSPFGMALVGDSLYVACTDAVLRFAYKTGDTHIVAPGTLVAALPAGTINHHWTKNLVANPDGSKLYVSVGSNSNVAERGMEVEAERAAIWEVSLANGSTRVFASGLRNPVGMAWEPETAALWAVVNERDELGSDLVPDYLTSVRDGAFYGWPYSYYGAHVDERAKPPRPDLVARATAPDYALGPHVAALGLAWSAGNTLPSAFAHGMFIGEHGSWNRKPPSGYKVVFVPFTQDGRGMPQATAPVDVLTGFLSKDGKAHGRPVGVAIDKQGALLVADDVGNTIWCVSSKP